MSFTVSLVHAFDNFNLSNQLKIHVLDKERHVIVAYIAHQKLAKLAGEWETLGIRSYSRSFNFAAKTIFYTKLLTAISTFIFKAIGLPREEQAVKFLDNGINEVINYSEPITLAASATSYFAMMYFGFYIPSSVGLAGIALTFAKQNGYLPASLEKKLIPLRFACRTYSLITDTQINIFLKYLELFCLFSEMTVYFLPNRYNEVPFKHTLNEIRSLGDDRLKKLAGKSVDEQKKLLKRAYFQVNSSSVHSAKLITLPNQNDIDPSTDTFKDLFSTIESYFPGLEISVSRGWGRLKNVLVNDMAPEDDLPTNYEAFRQLMHYVLVEVQKKRNTDPDGFKNTILELNEIGDACVTGWVHRLSALTDPKINDMEWMVHFFTQVADN